MSRSSNGPFTVCPRSSDPYYILSVLHKNESLLLGHTVLLSVHTVPSPRSFDPSYIVTTVCLRRSDPFIF